MFNGIKHMVIPVFGLLANLACMLFYLVGPFVVAGMSWQEPFVALGFCRPVGRSTAGSTSCPPARPRASRSCITSPPAPTTEAGKEAYTTTN